MLPVTLLCLTALLLQIYAEARVLELFTLPYARNALEPHISKETIDYHYGKHVQAYVNNVNKIVGSNPSLLATLSLEDLVTTQNGTLFNNAAQVWNHEFYFNCMTPNQGEIPPPLKQALTLSFGSIAEFKAAYTNVALSHFGSGWVWLVWPDDASGVDGLQITHTDNAMNPLRDESGIPILATDVWEHSYYIDYRNDRAEHIKAWWKVVNWDKVNSHLTEAKKTYSKKEEL